MPKDKLQLLEQLLAELRAQGERFEKLFRLAGHRLTGDQPLTPEVEESITRMMQAWNRPIDLYKAETLRRIDLQDKNNKRQAGIVSANNQRQEKATTAYQHYRAVAKKLVAERPALAQASQQRLAQRVQSELTKEGRRASTRTILRALRSKKV